MRAEVKQWMPTMPAVQAPSLTSRAVQRGLGGFSRENLKIEGKRSA